MTLDGICRIAHIILQSLLVAALYDSGIQTLNGYLRTALFMYCKGNSLITESAYSMEKRGKWPGALTFTKSPPSHLHLLLSIPGERSSYIYIQLIFVELFEHCMEQLRWNYMAISCLYCIYCTAFKSECWFYLGSSRHNYLRSIMAAQ